MSSEDDTRAHRTLDTGRLEAFSDNAFSIAATLLVLDLAIHPPGTPLEQVLHAWPEYLAYVVSFLTIGAAWLAHSALTDRLTRTDSMLLRLNLLLLLVVAFLPFPTRLVASALHHEGSERVFVTMYGLSLVAIRVLGFALAAYARRERRLGRASSYKPTRPRRQTKCPPTRPAQPSSRSSQPSGCAIVGPRREPLPCR